MTDSERAALLAFADDEHLMGQRHTEWIGVAPFLEEDLAFSSIAQDELGHAAALYEILLADAADAADAGDLGDADLDRWVFGRGRDEWRSCWLVEEPCTDWADALVRHWLYDAAEELRWRAFADWDHGEVRDLADRALSEEQYHRRHADALLDALDGDVEAARRIAQALDQMLPLAVAMFDGTPVHDGVPAAWRDQVDRRFGWRDWASVRPPEGHDRRRRSDHFDEVYGRMCEVFTIDPTARW